MFELVIIFLCLLFNAVLACAEIAFVSVRKAHLYPLSEKGDSRAKLLLQLKNHPEKVLSIIQVGITFAGMLAAAFGGSTAEGKIVPWIQNLFSMQKTGATLLSVLIVVIPLTYLNVVFAELVPKILALRNPSFFAMHLVRFLRIANIFLLPIVKILEFSTSFIVKFFSKIFGAEKTVHEEEMVELGELRPRSRQYVLNIVNVEKKVLKEVMLLWDKVTFVRKGQDFMEIEKIIFESGHTRVPVLEGDEVLGILHTKQFLCWAKRQKDGDWTSILRPIQKYEANTSLFAAFFEMQKSKTHMALVTEQGKKLGIVTLEDILEEIVGEIYDEYDPV